MSHIMSHMMSHTRNCSGKKKKENKQEKMPVILSDNNRTLKLCSQSPNEQTYQSTVIWLIRPLSVYSMGDGSSDEMKLLFIIPDHHNTVQTYGVGQPPFQYLAPGCKQPSPDNDIFLDYAGFEFDPV